jgi:catechol 2,3-dioxygenase-like lactoylglutathione lyase family enzyme
MKINIRRLNHVQICIPFGAEDEARAFYGRLLGLEEIEKPEVLKRDGGLWFQTGDIQLHVGVEDVGDNRSKRHPAFEVERLADVRAYLLESGVRVKDEPPAPGFKRLSFFDPFGNRVELMEASVS